jgi:uncharacterized protein (TIGR00369 family)
MASPNFDQYDEEVARGMAAVHGDATGLPSYLDIAVTDYGPGMLVAKVPVRTELLNPFGTLHGGVLAAFVDHMLGTVCYPVMRRGQWAATAEFKINYLAPVDQGDLVATSTIISLTKRTAVVRIDITNGSRLVCAAQGTVLIVDPKPNG